MIAHVLTFAAHRRTLVALAFAARRRRLGWGDPMRWVAACLTSAPWRSPDPALVRRTE